MTDLTEQGIAALKEGLIAFDIIPLIPYSGFSRLFAKEP